VARILHDTYFRAGPNRPLRELTASVAARARGVSVPAVVAGAVYPAGPLHYRADLVTELVPDARDLAEVLFGHPEQERRAEAGGDRAAALRATGQLVAQAGAAGVHHPDLNAKNVVLRLTAPNALDVDAWIVDLDRCRVRAAPRPEADTGAMLGRLERSLRKFERAGGRRLADDDWIALRQGAGDWRSVHRRGSDPGASGGAG
jgi:tRNA A-37 threonylcarbamoyl transferase component Bud32